MTDYIITILSDDIFRLCIVTFGGLFLSAFLIGYFISLVISLLYKISGDDHGKG